MNKEERKRLAFQEGVRAKMLKNPLVSEIELPPPRGGEMNHTPGRWHISPSGQAIMNDAMTHLIADCSGNQHNLILLTSQEEQVANAKLIATAPTMYEALKEIAEVPLPDEGGYHTIDKHDAIGFIRIARRAIAKATQ